MAVCGPSAVGAWTWPQASAVHEDCTPGHVAAQGLELAGKARLSSLLLQRLGIDRFMVLVYRQAERGQLGVTERLDDGVAEVLGQVVDPVGIGGEDENSSRLASSRTPRAGQAWIA